MIVGGSPFDITTPENKKTKIQKKVEADFAHLFDMAVSADFPFIGACSGCGLLGSYCGAKISEKYAEAVGGVEIVLSEEGKKDPLLKGLPVKFRALTGHKEACEETPGKAVLLASSSSCPIEMFRVGKNVYATQFHPEAGVENFALRINVYKNYGYFPPEDAGRLTEAVRREKIVYPGLILKNFVNRYRRI